MNRLPYSKIRELIHYSRGGGYTNTVTLPNNAFSFQINGVDEWTYIYTDYDVFAKQARKFFVLVTKNED
ncbi:hypothetical protein HMPREF0102_00787 [Bacteroides sp. 2_1_22]|nr:hypothetical protein HMPREF0102_00787 [Bacteroides sp. 2_1_22]